MKKEEIKIKTSYKLLSCPSFPKTIQELLDGGYKETANDMILMMMAGYETMSNKHFTDEEILAYYYSEKWKVKEETKLNL